MSPPTVSPDPAEYVYVDTAVGGVNHRNNVRRAGELRVNGQADVYESYQRATDELVEWVRTHTNDRGNPTVGGFDGATWTPFVPLDFDNERDPGVALGWVRSLIDKLQIWDVPLSAPRFYFSGSKGFGVELPAALFGGFHPSSELPRNLKRLAQLIMGDIPFDPSLYDRLRLWRLPNTRHGKTNLYKVQLTAQEILTLSIDEIRGLAQRPRDISSIPALTPIADDEWIPVQALVDLWDEAERTPSATRERRSGAVTDEARDRQTVAAIAAGWPSGGRDDIRASRHTEYLMPIAGFLAGHTSAEHAADLLKQGARQAADQSFLTGRDWESEIDRIAESSSAKRRSDDQHVTGLPTLEEKFPVVANVLAAVWPRMQIEFSDPEPGDPDPGDDDRRGPVAVPDTWPEPPDPIAYAGLAGRVVDAIRPHSESDPVALVTSFLTAFGCAVGPGPHALVAATVHPPRLFTALVGRSAKARKGDSWQPIRALMVAADPTFGDRVQGGLSTGEGLIAEVRDPQERTEPIKEKGRITGYQTVIVDRGVEDKRLLVVEPEHARVLRVMGRQGNSLSAVLRDAYDHGTLRVMTRTNPLRATGSHIAKIAHITVDELRRELTDTEAANGGANREIWLAVRRSGELAEPEPFTVEAFPELVEEIRDALRHARNVRLMVRDADARALWHEVYHDLSAERDGLAGSILARSETHVLRLSLIYALLDRSPVVRVEHLAAALELWAYAERSVEHIFGDLTGDPIADVILKALRQNGDLTRTQISDLFGRNESSARIALALSLLLTRGKATMQTKLTGGRSAEVWRAR